MEGTLNSGRGIFPSNRFSAFTIVTSKLVSTSLFSKPNRESCGIVIGSCNIAFCSLSDVKIFKSKEECDKNPTF